MERQKFNRQIVEILSILVEKHPDLRFGQILVNSGIIEVCPSDKQLLAKDPFYEEPEVTWKRIVNNNFVFKPN